MPRKTDKNPRVTKADPKPPPPEEWDFREITELELFTSTQYEYARSDDGLADEIKRWQSRQFEIDSLERLASFHGVAEMIRIFRHAKNLTNKEALTAGYKLSEGPDFFDQERLLFYLRVCLLTSLPENVRKKNIGDILVRFADFPEPWMKLKKLHAEEWFLDKLLARPFSNPGVFLAHCNPVKNDVILSIFPHIREVKLLIDWSKPPGILVNDFKKLVVAQSSGIAPILKKPGRRPHWELLRWLAAYRLNEAGLSFRESQQIIMERRTAYPVVKTMSEFPNYKKPSNWSDVVSDVRAKLQSGYIEEIHKAFSPD